MKLRSIRELSRSNQVAKIQSIWRMFNSRKRTNPLLLRWRATKMIQHFCRRWCSIDRFHKAALLMLRYLTSAFFIQRVFRGYQGRKRVYFLRTRKNRAVAQMRLESQDTAMEYYFEQNGAASKIQRWYKMIGWKFMLRRQRRKQQLAIVHDKSARVLQHLCINFSKLMIVYRWRRALWKMQEIRWTNVIIIQRLCRRFLVRCRMLDKHRRYFKIKKYIQVQRPLTRAPTRPGTAFTSFSASSMNRPDTSTSIRSMSLSVGSLKDLTNLFSNDMDEVDPKYLVSERDRRVAYLYPNLKLGGLAEWDSIEAAARKIQHKWIWSVGKYLQEKAMEERRLEMSSRLVRWYLS